MFTPIDFNTWPRRELFYYFSRMAPTGYSLTTSLDVTQLRKAVKILPCLSLAGHPLSEPADGIQMRNPGRTAGIFRHLNPALRHHAPGNPHHFPDVDGIL